MNLPPAHEMSKSSDPLLDLPADFVHCTQWAGSADRRRAISTLQLTGLYCAACAPTIERALSQVAGVESAQVNGSSRRALVQWDPLRAQAQDLIAAVQKAGYGAAADAPQSWQTLRRQERRTTLWRLFVASFCAMQVMMMATPSYVAQPGELPPDLRQLLNWGSWVLSIPALWFAGSSYWTSAWRSLRRRQMSMDVPVALALAATFIGSTVATFNPSGPLGDEVYFDSLTMFLAFLWVGRFLEMHARHRAEDHLQSRLDDWPEKVMRVCPDGDIEEVSLHALRAGDRVRVAMGASVPADGALLSAQARVSEAMMTGESSGVLKQAGEKLWAGSLNQGAALELQVQKVGPDTRYAQIMTLMREAMSLKPEVAALADRWAGPFLVGVLCLAIGSTVVWSWLDPSRALWVGVAVLTVTCPCALSLALPATWTALAMGLARRGVLIRRFEAIEAMAALKQVVLDKTGTLTTSGSVLERVELLGELRGELTREQALAVAVGLAQWSQHPLSRALIEAAHGAAKASASNAAASELLGAVKAVNVESVNLESVNEVAGAGLEALDAQGRTWRLGRRDWVCAGETPASPSDRGLHLWLGCNGQCMAAFEVAEHVHPHAQELVKTLGELGVAVSLVSGDQNERVMAVANRLGIGDAHGQASPEQKLQILKSLRARVQPVGMVGDGVNDAPTLAAADVSFAMGQGAYRVRSNADAILVGEDPLGVAWAVRGSRRALAIARQNLRWALFYNLACIPLALMGSLPPWAAGLGMAASSTWVILNAQRASWIPLKPLSSRQ